MITAHHTCYSAGNKTQHNQTQDYPWLPFVYLLEPWLQFWMVGHVPFHLNFLSSLGLLHLHLHLLLPIALQKSGSRESKWFRITGLSYEDNEVSVLQVKCPLYVTIAVYNSDWKGRLLGNTISIWNAWKLAGILLARWPRETHVLQKSLQKFNTQKEHFNWFLFACAY